MILIFGFKIDMSVNRQYYMKEGKFGKRLTQEALGLRARIQEAVKNQLNQLPDFGDQEPLEVLIHFQEEWFCQNGNPKRKDLDNRLKFLIDSVFKELEIDDKYIFKIVAEKIESENELCTMIIRRFDDGTRPMAGEGDEYDWKSCVEDWKASREEYSDCPESL